MNSRIRDQIRQYRMFPTFVASALRRLERHLGLHVWYIFLRPTGTHFQLPDEHAARFTFKRLTLEEALASSKNKNLHLSADFVRDAFERNDVCVGAFDGRKLVAYAWRTLKRAPVTNQLWLHLRRRDVRYGYKAYVLPEYRGLRIHQSVARFYDQHFAKMGVTNGVGYVALSNLASLRGRSRFTGEKKIGYAGYLQIGTWYWTFRTPQVRDYLAFEVR